MTQQNFHKFFIFYFIIFGIIISAFSSFVSYKLQMEDSKNSLDKKAKEIFDIKLETILKPRITNMDNIAKSLHDNKILKDFLISKDINKQKELEDIFLAIVNSNTNIMKARFIDKNGMEIVRIDRNNENENAFIIEKDKLQNRSNKDYFKILSNNKDETIWHSKFDLGNEITDEILKPTLKIAISVFNDNKFSGIIIINVFITNLFNSIGFSSTFDHYIIDKNQNFILHPKNEFSFNAHKNIPRDMKNDFPNGLEEENIYKISLNHILKNEDEATLILKTKTNYQKELIDTKLNTAIIVLGLTVLLSLFMAIIVSRTPIKLQRALLKAHEKLNQFTSIIDKFVITSTTKIDSTILDVSDAFEKSSGYNKDELIGQKMSIIKHPKQDRTLIKSLWDTILSGKVWTGELLNKKKNGENYWLEQYIIPTINEESGKIETFVSVGIDITAKKEIEKLASIDKLTGIYNRRLLDEFLEIEMEVAKRYKEELSIILLDIDYFKKVNDTFGHLVGDEILTTTSKIISENLRNSDIFGRYGGEEFLIICAKTSEENALILAEKLRVTIENHKFPHVEQKTISLGITSFEKNDTIKSLFKKADLALYKAKHTGRNKAIIYKKEL